MPGTDSRRPAVPSIPRSIKSPAPPWSFSDSTCKDKSHAGDRLLNPYEVRYPPIGDYGMVGDLHSAALISRQGSVDWMCLPRFDSPWIFGRLLDWDKGGFLDLTPALPGAEVFRQYRRDSNILQTIWTLGHTR